MSERKPFHESIVDVLNSSIARGMAPGYELQTLARLIISTKIPKNHDAIIAAWKKLVENVTDNGFYASVAADLIEQKQETEAKEAAKQEKGQ